MRILEIPLIIAGSSQQNRQEKVQELISIEFGSAQPHHPDLLVFDQPLSFGINDIRKIYQFVSRKAWQKKKKFVIILEPRKFTSEAQNAFLKLLEEKSPQVTFIISLPNQNLLLDTILSRSQTINLKSEDKPREEEVIDLEEISGLTTAERLTQSNKLSFIKNSDQFLYWVENLLNGIHQKIVRAKGNLPELKVLKDQAKVLSQARKMLSLSINPQSVFDWIMLHLTRNHVSAEV